MSQKASLIWLKLNTFKVIDETVRNFAASYASSDEWDIIKGSHYAVQSDVR